MFIATKYSSVLQENPCAMRCSAKLMFLEINTVRQYRSVSVYLHCTASGYLRKTSFSQRTCFLCPEFWYEFEDDTRLLAYLILAL